MNDKHRHHAPRPALCAHCLAAFFASIPAGDRRVAFLHCPHSVAGGTLARCDVDNGVIRSWRLLSPVSVEEAEQSIAAYGRALSDAGLLDAPAPGGPAEVN